MAFYQLADGESMSVTGGETTATLTYVAYHYALVADVYAAAVANTPTGYGGGSRLAIKPTLLGGQTWRVEVEYGAPTGGKPALDENTTPATLPPPPPPADPQSVPPLTSSQPVPLAPLEGQLGGPPGAGSFDPPGGGDGGDGTGGGLGQTPGREEALGGEWSFDTTGGTQKVLQSIFTPYSRAYGGFAVQAPDVKGAIGATEDGVEGVEIVAPKLRVTCTRTVRKVAGGYVDAMSAITGSVNNAPFLWWAEGEVLFVGMSGPFKAPAGWTLTWEWWISKNRKDVVIIPPDDRPGATAAERAGLVIPFVEGWQYLEVAYAAEEKADGNGKKRVRRLPSYAYVHQVYYKKDFSAIGFK